MEMSSRRSNYTLLSQNPDEPIYHQPPPQQSKLSSGGGGGGGLVSQQHLYYESHSGEKNKLKSAQAPSFDWDAIDQRMTQAQQQSRIGTTPFQGSFGLQRQSSGSSFGESSISGEYFAPSFSNPEMKPHSHFSDGGGEFRVKTVVDFIAEAYGLLYLPPYLALTEGEKKIEHGLNFAVAGAAAQDSKFFYDLGIRQFLWTNSSLSVQLVRFNKIKSTIFSTKQVTYGGAWRKNHSPRPSMEYSEEDEIPKTPLFEKPLTPSDVGKLNRLVIPKKHAENYFPMNAAAGDPKGCYLSFEDEAGKSWRFRYSY